LNVPPSAELLRSGALTFFAGSCSPANLGELERGKEVGECACPSRLRFTGLSASLALGRKTAADLAFDGRHVQRCQVSAVSLLQTQGDFAAQVLMPESSHVLGFSQPAIQLPAVLRRKPLRCRFDFCHRAHGEKPNCKRTRSQPRRPRRVVRKTVLRRAITFSFGVERDSLHRECLALSSSGGQKGRNWLWGPSPSSGKATSWFPGLAAVLGATCI